MSFLGPNTGAAGTAQFGAPIPANAAANGLGQLLGGVEGSRVGDIASRIGTASNRFAEIGGAPAGYDGPARGMNSDLEARIAALRARMPGRDMNSGAEMGNVMQALNPGWLQQVMQQFRGQGMAR